VVTKRGQVRPAVEAPGDRIPIYGWAVQEAMVKELRGERWTPSGMWIPNTVQPTWELGKRYGLPMTIRESLDISAGAAFMNGPADRKRWHVVGISHELTAGPTRFIVRPKDASDVAFQLNADNTTDVPLIVPWPGIIVENDPQFGGGDLGLEQGGGGDTAIDMTLLLYEVDM